MGASVDAGGQAAGDDATAAGQVAGQLLGHGPSVRGGPAGADDGHRGISKSLRIALAIEDERRIEDLSQVPRVPGAVKGQKSIRFPSDFFQFLPGPVDGPPRHDGLDGLPAQAEPVEVGPGGPEDIGDRGKAAENAAGGRARAIEDQVQGQPAQVSIVHGAPSSLLKGRPARPNRPSRRATQGGQRIPLEAARDIASQIPVVEGGPAKRGEPHELVPGAGELEADSSSENPPR